MAEVEVTEADLAKAAAYQAGWDACIAYMPRFRELRDQSEYRRGYEAGVAERDQVWRDTVKHVRELALSAMDLYAARAYADLLDIMVYRDE